MSMRRVMIVLLCEDSQHESFIRRFLKTMGWDTRQMRIEKSPFARGSAEQWVRRRFPVEIQACRSRRTKASTMLVAMVDGDNKNPDERIRELAVECEQKNISFRDNQEPVAIAVPCRNIETWIRYLDGEQVNEDEVYPKFDHERTCRVAVARLAGLCRAEGLPGDAPSALKLACDEYNRRIRPVGR
ncbi:conserved hypothetical protein [Desulfonatronospira thiodismutans ASO3-1]|uniref:DUF4276 family protein n=1 Tax=Desulfonatronospira thiodismutans ASO3-1 TaxID=555779 RepID=D6SU61_9BACT|nr:hypothetical protein [Desulfonatronospira thiodismutans]EFI32841.1 conserved hypothetical protein [Desulfonatronospira thiodismutans ASO3-1]